MNPYKSGHQVLWVQPRGYDVSGSIYEDVWAPTDRMEGQVIRRPSANILHANNTALNERMG